MAVKVLVERTARPGVEMALPSLLRQLRAEAMHQPGYQYGETLRSVRQPRTFLVVSTWSSAQHWWAWEKDPARRKIEAKIAGFLEKKPVVRVFEEHYESSGALRSAR